MHALVTAIPVNDTGVGLTTAHRSTLITCGLRAYNNILSA